jgi:hypothetical protein
MILLDIPPLLRRALPLVLVGAVLGVLAGCDAVSIESGEVDRRSDDPNEVEIRADSFTRADLLFEPVSISEGETFSIELMDANRDQNVTRITHEGISDERKVLRAHFDPLQPASVDVNCRNEKADTEQRMATIQAPKLKSSDNGTGAIASMEKEPTSYHYIENGDDVIVEVDYDTDTSTEGVTPGAVFDFPSSTDPVQCTHVGFVLEGVSGSVAANGVRFNGGDREPRFRKKNLR